MAVAGLDDRAGRSRAQTASPRAIDRRVDSATAAVPDGTAG